MSAGWPARWQAMMAQVRSVMRSATESGSRLKVSGSTSAKTGMHCSQTMGITAPGSVMGGEMTSWWGSGRSAARALCMAAVPELVAVAKAVPTCSANSRS